MTVYQIVPGTGKLINWLTKHKSDIMTYGGLALITAGTVSACVGTAKMIKEEEEIKKKPTVVKRAVARGKHYVLAAGLIGTGAYFIHSSHQIVKAENLKLKDEIASIAAGTMALRERWKEKVGEEVEKKIFDDEKTEEVTDENGKKKKVTVSNIDPRIATEVYFDRWCSWAADEHGDMEYDAMRIDNAMGQLSNALCGTPKRYIMLNEAYHALQLFRVNEFGQRVEYETAIGQCCGWIWDKQNPTGDNTVVITRTKTTRRLEDGTIVPTWKLEFNHDGNILKELEKRGLM